jgi:uncharacterized protein (TIGR02996 family)
MEETFLQQILEQPDDEVVRLAYADWLLERGDPVRVARGEFIQVQCQFARRAEGGGNPAEWIDSGRLPELKAREQALLAAFGETWSAPVKKLLGRVGIACEFRRGFIEAVSVESSAFLNKAAELFQLAPIRHMRFTTGWSKALADSPHLARLAGIDLQRQNIGDAGLRLLLAARHLGNLQTLDLSYNRLTDAGATALAGSRLLGQLSTLNLAYNQLSMQGVRTLYESPHWGRVRTLTLTGNTRTDARVLTFLAQSLQGNYDTALLRSLLQLTSRQEHEYTNRPVRELAQRAGANPAAAARVLGEGLRGAHRKLRSAAAQMLAQLGPAAAPSVPLLVQRLFENNPLVRDHAAPALARLLPELPAQLQAWLCLMANPQLPPLANLRAALSSTQVPEGVRSEFALVCARRIAWRQHIAAGKAGPAPVPDPATVGRDTPAILQSIATLGALAEQHAVRNLVGGPAHERAAKVAREKEHAWLLARLCELLQATLPPEPAPARKKRR